MRAEIIFMTAVLGIAGIHLLSRLGSFLTRHKATKTKVASEQKMRDDWYVFFDKTALFGASGEVSEEQKVIPEAVVETDRKYVDTHQTQTPDLVRSCG